MNGERPRDPTDTERDAWLREALRHAPDAQVGPPPALSQLILREAQAKAKTSAAPPRPPVAGALRWWAWLARPSVGAAFASVMAASAVGLLWWDRPPQEHAPRTTAPMPAPEAGVVAPANGDRAMAGADDAAPPAAPPTSEPAQSAAAPKGEAARRPARDKAAARPQAERRETAPTPPSAGIAGRMAAVAPTTPAPATAAPPAPVAPVAPEAAAAPPPSMATTRPPSITESSAPLAAAKQADTRQRVAIATIGPAMAELRASLAVDATRWSWQRGSGPARPAGDGLAAWFAEVDTATQRRWQAEPASSAPGTSHESAPVSDELVLLHDGHVVHRWHVDGSAIRWDIAAQDANAPSRWQARLDAAQARTLRLQLDDATR